MYRPTSTIEGNANRQRWVGLSRDVVNLPAFFLFPVPCSNHHPSPVHHLTTISAECSLNVFFIAIVLFDEIRVYLASELPAPLTSQVKKKKNSVCSLLTQLTLFHLIEGRSIPQMQGNEIIATIIGVGLGVVGIGWGLYCWYRHRVSTGVFISQVHGRLALDRRDHEVERGDYEPYLARYDRRGWVRAVPVEPQPRLREPEYVILRQFRSPGDLVPERDTRPKKQNKQYNQQQGTQRQNQHNQQQGKQKNQNKQQNQQQQQKGKHNQQKIDHFQQQQHTKSQSPAKWQPRSRTPTKGTSDRGWDNSDSKNTDNNAIEAWAQEAGGNTNTEWDKGATGEQTAQICNKW